jgi:hypothetical protein
MLRARDNLHGVCKIKFGPPEFRASDHQSKSFWSRRLILYGDEEGNEMRLDLYADTQEALLTDEERELAESRWERELAESRWEPAEPVGEPSF